MATYKPLSTDFKDDILASQNSKRKYTQVNNSDGTVSFQDSTAYSQVGSSYGAKEIIEEREAINNIHANKLVTLDEIDLVTEPGFFVDAQVVKELNSKIPHFYNGEIVLHYYSTTWLRAREFVGKEFVGCYPQVTCLYREGQPNQQTTMISAMEVDSDGYLVIWAYGGGYVSGHMLGVSVSIRK